MISIGKSIDISKKSFGIPSPWRKKMNITQGGIVQISIKSNCMIFKTCHQFTTENTSTIGRGGVIYIPVEVRNHFQLKGITRLELFFNEDSSTIICKEAD